MKQFIEPDENDYQMYLEHYDFYGNGVIPPLSFNEYKEVSLKIHVIDLLFDNAIEECTDENLVPLNRFDSLYKNQMLDTERLLAV